MHSGTTDIRGSPRERRNREIARRAAAEGVVLLKNDGLLPLDKGQHVALLGGGAARTVRGGTGSGEVNVRNDVSILEGMKNAGFRVTSEAWLRDFALRYLEARRVWKDKITADCQRVSNPFDAYAANPFRMPEGRKLSEADIAGANAAVYVISRSAGEGKDRLLEKGDYYLSDREREDLAFLDAKGIPVALLVNSGGPVELTDVMELPCIRALMFLSQPGQEGGNAVADLLSGDAVPSGKLTCTWARRYNDYPSCAQEFSDLNGDLSRDQYTDGIYVGYRWFDSFSIKPLFPFGYGLSYTCFSTETTELHATAGSAVLTVCVTNTGTRFSGKEIVQVYAFCPGQLPKERRRLVGFQKTKLLEPGEKQLLRIEIGQMELASFDPLARGWTVEAGRYLLSFFSETEPEKAAGTLFVERDVIIRRVAPICPLKETLKEIVAPEAPRPSQPPISADCLFIPVPERTAVPSSEAPGGLAASLPVEQLIPLLCGNVVPGGSAFGSAGLRVPGSAGETTQALEAEYGVPSLIMADGPAGLRLRKSYQVDRRNDTVYPVPLLAFFEGGALVEEEVHENADTYYQYCTAFPVGTLLAQTWNTALLEETGHAVAEEMEEFGVQLWLAPGINIQRNPLCGRNFEYYSEDPLLTGRISAAMIRGVQASGTAGATVKHLACNNQENNRMGVDAVLSERALREIYLRGFSIAIREAQPLAIMTSYNKINGVHTANSLDLCTRFAREECGFQGLILTDWTTTFPEGGSIPWQCIDAGNDLIMPGSPGDLENIRSACVSGKLREESLRRSANRVLRLVEQLTAQAQDS